MGLLLPALTEPAQNLTLLQWPLCSTKSLGGARARAITRRSRVPPSIPATGRRPPRNCVLQYPRWIAHRSLFLWVAHRTTVRVELQLSRTLPPRLRYLGGALPELLRLGEVSMIAWRTARLRTCRPPPSRESGCSALARVPVRTTPGPQSSAAQHGPDPFQ